MAEWMRVRVAKGIGLGALAALLMVAGCGAPATGEAAGEAQAALSAGACGGPGCQPAAALLCKGDQESCGQRGGACMHCGPSAPRDPDGKAECCKGLDCCILVE